MLSHSVTLQMAGQRCQGQTLQLVVGINKLQRK
jgi:hypothetical protein